MSGLYYGSDIMNEKKSWDDIPSLDGIGVDWEYKPDNPLGKRAFVRVQKGELHTLFEARQIIVRVADGKVDTRGVLNDISEGGLSVNLKIALSVNQPVKVGFFLGTQKIVSRAEVKQVKKHEGKYKIGFAFVGLKKEYKTFLAGVYAAMILNNA